MKLIKKIVLVLVLVLTFTMFTGCIRLVKSEKTVTVIEDTIPTEITVKDFDLSKIRLHVEFDNGTSGMVSLDESMLVNDKLSDILVVGERTIRVKYRDCMVDFKVNLLEKYPDVNVKFVFGEEELSSKTLEKHTKVGELPVPEKEGYRFDGWYLESFFQTLVTPDTVIDDACNIYGKFTPITYTVRFLFGEENKVLEEKVLFNDKIYFLPEAFQSGKEFDGWYTESGTKVTLDTVITGDLVVNARFK